MPKNTCIINSETQQCADPQPDLDHIGNLFADAFASYPLFERTLPDVSKRKSRLRDLHKMITCYGVKRGKVYTTPHNEAIAVVARGKGSYLHTTTLLRCGAAKIPFTLGRAFMTKNAPYQTAMDALHDSVIPSDHLYLWAIATDPKFQGKGFGTQLLQRIIADADAMHLPLYLETSKSENVRLYEKTGFAVAQTVEIDGLPIWAMKKDPTNRSLK